MKIIIAVALLICFVGLSYEAPNPQRNTSVSPNPQVNLIRQGLIEKLCKQKYPNLKVTTTTEKPGRITTTTTTKASRVSTLRSTTYRPPSPVNPRFTTTPVSGPTCGDFNNLSFEELINKVKSGLKPVSTSTAAPKKN